MKHKARIRELDLGNEAFALVPDRGEDGARIAREIEQRERQLAELAQLERENQTDLFA